MPLAPQLAQIDPAAALPGGEIRLHGQELSLGGVPDVSIGESVAPMLIASGRMLVVRVPDQAVSGPLGIALTGGRRIHSRRSVDIGTQIAEDLHPVCNPALDPDGNIVVTKSGPRGQKTPISLYRLDANYTMKPMGGAVTNPSGLAYGVDGMLYVSSRHDGSVYQVDAAGEATLYAEGMGVATGLAFDAAGDLYVGDRTGTIFKIDAKRKTFVFATLEPSIAAYHLAFGPDQYLYVSSPTTTSNDAVWRVSPRGEAEIFVAGLGRPQGVAFDQDGGLLVVASHQGRRGVVRITPDGNAEHVVSGNGLVGLAFAPGPALILATQNALYHLAWNRAGAPLPPRATGRS